MRTFQTKSQVKKRKEQNLSSVQAGREKRGLPWHTVHVDDERTLSGSMGRAVLSADATRREGHVGRLQRRLGLSYLGAICIFLYLIYLPFLLMLLAIFCWKIFSLYVGVASLYVLLMFSRWCASELILPWGRHRARSLLVFSITKPHWPSGLLHRRVWSRSECSSLGVPVWPILDFVIDF